MPTSSSTGRYATMTAAQVIEEQARLLNIWTAEDAERAARFAAILAK